MEKKKLYKHETECFACFDMVRRGYEDESEYWDDFFGNKEKPIIYELTYRGKPFTEDNVKEYE